jgi:formate dehydrogenase beta subunit
MRIISTMTGVTMDQIIFSSWGNKIVNRGKPEKVHDLPSLLQASAVSGLVGWDGLVVADRTVNVVDMLGVYLEEAQKISCGECVTCNLGIEVLADVHARILKGKGRLEDLNILDRFAAGIKENAKCNFGMTVTIPLLDALKHRRGDYLRLIREKKAVKREKYNVIATAPCSMACPAHLDVPGYIELMKHNRHRESLELIRKGCILPGVVGRVCPRPCESECVRSKVDSAVAINGIKRFVADSERPPDELISWPVAERKEKVAIVGAGPAGLSAAYSLRQKGYPVTVFEGLPRAGGMAAVGIPDYRLPKQVLQKEIDRVEQTGLRFVLNKKVGEDLFLSDLEEEGFQSIFLALGAHQGRTLEVEGEKTGMGGVIDGVRFLRETRLEKPRAPGRSVVVIGGGDVAIDCARTCIRLCEQVILLYRRSKDEMPARPEDVQEAEKEGVQFQCLAAPLRVITTRGKVTTLVCSRMRLGKVDASGRRTPVPIPHSSFEMKTDAVIAAIGQYTDPVAFSSEPTLLDDVSGKIEADPQTLATRRKGIFSGGDCVTGPATLIEALAAGARAAESMDRFLSKKPSHDKKEETWVREFPWVNQREMGAFHQQKRGEPLKIPIEARKEYAREVEATLDPKKALAEARRCLRCYRILVYAKR